MTKKLYDENSYATTFNAEVLSCERTDKGYEIVLDKTLFFPEEGGQSADEGTLNGNEITDVQIKNDVIYHYCTSPFEIGEHVEGNIDFKSRYRKMQNHTGEHIICGIAHKLYGYENVGFHLGADYVTMDLDGPLTREQIDEIETLANEAVYANKRVICDYPPQKELDRMFYRCKSEIAGNVRIVTIDGYDTCACCAPHVNMTGEIGVIKILDAINYKGGVRLNILCGHDALLDYRERYERNTLISNLLSAKQNDVVNAVEKLLDDNGKLKQKLFEKSKKIATMYVESIKDGENCVCLFTTDMDRDSMKLIANGAKDKVKKLLAVLDGNDNEGYSYIIASDSIDLKEYSPFINSALNGRGGGNSTMIQGTFNSDRVSIEEFFYNLPI